MVPREACPVTLLVVRHAKAGDRGAWSGPDSSRPLSPNGRRQAEGLVDRISAQLGGLPIERILSSASLRCVQTVEPLAEALGLPIEPRAELAEGGDVERVLVLAHELMGNTAVLCSHGDVIPRLLDALASHYGLALPHAKRCEKGSTWILEPSRGRYRDARYLAPAN